MRPSSDGRITVENQLFPEAVSDAVGTYGFYADHVGILSSEKVLKQYNTILSGLDKEYEEEKQSPAGRMQVRFSFDSRVDQYFPEVVFLQ